jgi:nitrilase
VYNLLKVALAQISPVWLDKTKTIEKVKSYIEDAGKQQCNLIAFGEALLPGYPFWLSLTNDSSFNDTAQKEIHPHYIRNAIQIEAGDLNSICLLAKENNIPVYLRVIERLQDRGGYGLHCSLVV